MKKALAVFMAILMAFSVISLVAFAQTADDETTTAAEETTVPRYPEDEGVSNIVNDEGLVFPTNPTQLEMSFVFKIVERIINFFMGLFGSDLDMNLTNSVSDFGVWLDEVVSNIYGSLN